ncbi:hypothetical protein B0H13DRAFT_634169 [Mycena leptocephala]|nr:hypothetical protein B0H13DRAFT_634169 [Mycena leptocephala]
MENLRISKAPIPPADPKILEPFRALIRLQWVADAKFSFSAPAPRFSALANLQQLCLLDTKSAAILDLCLQLSLPSLREVHLAHVNAPAAIAFLELHGSKLVQLTATLEVVVKAKIFDLCTRLNTVAVIPSHGKNEDLPEDFIACSTPHSALAEIHIEFYILERRHELPMKRSIEGLKAESFPVLKEVKLSCIKWPTSEREIRKNKWIPLSETLRHKGIKLVDMYGVGGTGTGRNLV